MELIVCGWLRRWPGRSILRQTVLVNTWKLNDQLDATDGFYLLQNLLFARNVSGTIMPIIRSSRFIQMVAAFGSWRFGLQVVAASRKPDTQPTAPHQTNDL